MPGRIVEVVVFRMIVGIKVENVGVVKLALDVPFVSFIELLKLKFWVKLE